MKHFALFTMVTLIGCAGDVLDEDLDPASTLGGDEMSDEGPTVAEAASDADLPQDVIYATTLELRRYPWGFRSAGPGTAIYKSTDGGDTWTDLSTKAGLPKGDKGRIGIALAPTKPNRVWAIIDAAGADQGLYRTDDGGVGPERRSEQRHFQTGGGIVIAHEQIRLAQRPRVHGAGDRHAQRLMSPAAEVLHGGEQSRTHDGESGGRRHTR